MKQAILILMVFCVNGEFFAQETTLNEKSICDKWVVKKGWFDKESIELERLDTSKHKSIGTTFHFEITNPAGVYNVFDHKFSVNLYNPERLGMCGNGLLYTEKGGWSITEDQLTVDIKGGYRLESEFHYKIIYSASLKGDDLLILTKKKILSSEVKTHY